MSITQAELSRHDDSTETRAQFPLGDEAYEALMAAIPLSPDEGAIEVRSRAWNHDDFQVRMANMIRVAEIVRNNPGDEEILCLLLTDPQQLQRHAEEHERRSIQLWDLARAVGEKGAQAVFDEISSHGKLAPPGPERGSDDIESLLATVNGEALMSSDYASGAEIMPGTVPAPWETTSLDGFGPTARDEMTLGDQMDEILDLMKVKNGEGVWKGLGKRAIHLLGLDQEPPSAYFDYAAVYTDVVIKTTRRLKSLSATQIANEPRPDTKVELRLLRLRRLSPEAFKEFSEEIEGIVEMQKQVTPA